MVKKWFSQKHQPRSKSEPKSTYEQLEKERDALKSEGKRLQEQVAVLVIDEDALRRLTLRAIALLGKMEAGRKVGVALKKEIDVLVAEARSAGLIEEKSKEL